VRSQKENNHDEDNSVCRNNNNNGIMQTRDGKKYFYMPTYDIPELDNIAAAVFEQQGITVSPWECQDRACTAAWRIHLPSSGKMAGQLFKVSDRWRHSSFLKHPRLH
jgi:hypothetical protein